MRVLVLSQDLGQLGGVSNYFNTLALDKNPGIRYYNVNNESANKPWKKFIFLSFNYTRFLFIVYKYDLIHINPSLNFRSYHREMLFLILSKIFLKKTLVFFRGWDEEFEAKYFASKVAKFFFRNTYGRANSYIVLGECFKKKIVDLGVDSSKNIDIETTVADSIGIANFSLEKKFDSFEEEVKFLFISRIVKEKGVYIAVDAFRELMNTTATSVSLWIAGDGEELERVKKYVVKNKIERVHFTGDIRGESKSKILTDCHIMIFPTCHAEGLPNSILEGMLYGMPIISRPVGAVPDIVKNHVNGFLSNGVDSHAFSSHMKYLVNNKPVYEKISYTNHLKALQEFTTEKVRARIINLYQESLK
jgi:glycosyltransferase involved in cell wall biosynthesis